MGQTYKADFQVDNGSDYDKYYFSTTADQVSYTKDGKTTTVQDELGALTTGVVKYNPDTDSLDVYFNGVIVGSMPCGFAQTSKVIDFTKYSWSKTVSSDTLSVSAGNVSISAYGQSSSGAAILHEFYLSIDFTGYTKAKLSFQAIDNAGRFGLNDGIYKPKIIVGGNTFTANAGTYVDKELTILDNTGISIKFYTFSSSSAPTVVKITKLELVK